MCPYSNKLTHVHECARTFRLMKTHDRLWYKRYVYEREAWSDLDSYLDRLELQLITSLDQAKTNRNIDEYEATVARIQQDAQILKNPEF